VTTVLAIVTMLLLGSSSIASGQSLAQIAEQEASRRQRVAAGKQYTNENLKPESRPTGAERAAAPTDAAAPVAATPPPEAPASISGDKAEKPVIRERRPEAYWRARLQALRGHLARLQSEIKVLEARVQTLEEQGVGGGEMDLTRTALKGLRSNQQSYAQELEQVLARGRRDNVPADWLQ
jgi:hypothetical protein